ncbi:MAG: hypothetical protein ACLUJG_12215 [Lawsonibacter sp.]
MKALAEQYGFTLDTPVKDLPQKMLDMLLLRHQGGEDHAPLQTSAGGSGTMYCRPLRAIINNLERRYQETSPTPLGQGETGGRA